MDIRPLDLADASALADAYAVECEATRHARPGWVPLGETARILARRADNGCLRSLVGAFEGGRLIGFAASLTAHDTPDTSWVSVSVLPQRQRRGSAPCSAEQRSGSVRTARVDSLAALMLLASLGTSEWAAAAILGLGQACHGFGIGFSNSHEMSYRQSLTPDELQARTNTTMRSFNRAVIVIVAPLGGLLAVQAGNRSALVTAAIIFAAAAALLATSPFRNVRHDPMTSTTG